MPAPGTDVLPPKAQYEKELEAAIVRAGKDGNGEAVRALGGELQKLRGQADWGPLAVNPPDDEPPPDPKRTSGFGIPMLDRPISAANEFALGVPQSLENVGAFFTDPLVGAFMGKDALAAERKAREGRWDAASNQLVTDPNPAARTTGQIAGSMLLGPAKLLPKGGAIFGGLNRAVQGMLGGAAVHDSDESGNVPAAIGVGANVLLPPAISALANSKIGQNVIRGVGNLAAPVISGADDLAEGFLRRWRDEGPPVPPEAPAGAPAAPAAPPAAPRGPAPGFGPPVAPSPLQPLGPEAEANAETFRQIGVTNPTTGMVSRDPNVFTFEQNTARSFEHGQDLARQMLQIENSITDQAHGLVGKLGGARGEENTGRIIQSFLDNKRSEMQDAVKALYTKVRAERGAAPIGPPSGFLRRLDEPDVTDNKDFDSFRESVMRSLKRYGITGTSGLPRKGAVLTINQAEDLRQLIGKLGNPFDPNHKRIRGELIDALDDDVVEGVGDDAFRTARAAAKARFDEFKKTFAGRIADEGIPVEKVPGRILTSSLADIRAFRRSLLTGTVSQVRQGRRALQALRAQSISDLLTQSLDGDGRLRGATLNRLFEANRAKYREILAPADFTLLANLARANYLVKALPQGHSVNVSGTTPTLANMFATAPPAAKKGWATLLKRLAVDLPLHAGAGAIAPGVGNVAVGAARGGVDTALTAAAQQKLAVDLANKVRMAQNPQQAAAALTEMQREAQTNQAVADFLNKAGLGQLIGGTAAATAQ